MITNYYGFKCPKCGSTVAVGMSIGTGDSSCPSCGTTMVADKAPNTSIYSNVTCKKCNASFGMFVGNTCPCGEPFDD